MQIDRIPPWFASEKADSAAARLGEPEQNADRRGLSRPVRAKEAVHLTCGDGEVGAVGGAHAAEPLFEADGLNDRVHDSHATINSVICESRDAAAGAATLLAL